MDQNITGRQMAAARTLVGLTQAQLAAAARISVPTLKRMEGSDGAASGMPNNVAAVVAALEQAGVIFVAENGDGPGVRLRKPATPEAIAAKIEKLEAKADALKPEDGPPSPAKALKTMKRAVVKNEVRKLRNKLAATEARPRKK